MQKSLSDFYNGKKVFITGHTSFKGAWLCEALSLFGADITGYSYGVPTNPSLFEICKTENKMDSHYGDIRDLEELRSVFDKANPEIVFHLAAQPIVRESYRDPVKTYSRKQFKIMSLNDWIMIVYSIYKNIYKGKKVIIII